MDHGGRFVAFVLPGSSHQLELNYYPRRNPFYTPIRAGTEFDHLGFVVDDINAWAARLRRMGLAIVADWTERGLRLLFVRDPDENWLEIAGRWAPPSSARRKRPR